MTVKKKGIWLLISVLLAALTIWAVYSQNRKWSVSELVESIGDADPLWLATAVLCTVLFVLLEGVAILSILKGIGYPRSLHKGLLYSTADIYFSAITPSAAGGQPASALFIHADGVPAGVTTAVLLINLIFYTLSIVVLGLLAALTHFRLLLNLSLLSKLLIGAGYLVLIALTALFFAALKSSRKLFGTLGRFLRFLHRKKLVHRIDPKLRRLEKARKDFESCAEVTQGKTGVLLKAFLWNLGQRAAQIAVPMCLYLAFSGNRSMAGAVFSAQCLATVGYQCVPIPGAMGAADYLMLDIYSGLMGIDDAFRLEMLGRGLSFYFCVFICGIITFIGYLLLRKRERK